MDDEIPNERVDIVVPHLNQHDQPHPEQLGQIENQFNQINQNAQPAALQQQQVEIQVAEPENVPNQNNNNNMEQNQDDSVQVIDIVHIPHHPDNENGHINENRQQLNVNVQQLRNIIHQFQDNQQNQIQVNYLIQVTDNNRKLIVVKNAIYLKILLLFIVILKLIFTLVVLIRNKNYTKSDSFSNFVLFILAVDSLSFLIHSWVIIHLFKGDYRTLQNRNLHNNQILEFENNKYRQTFVLLQSLTQKYLFLKILLFIKFVFYSFSFIYGNIIFFMDDDYKGIKEENTEFFCLVVFLLAMAYIFAGLRLLLTVFYLIYMPFYYLVRRNQLKKQSRPQYNNVKLLKNQNQIIYSKDIDDQIKYDPLCPICYMDFEKKQKITQLKCKGRHVFHRECIQQWFQYHPNCPTCKQSLI